MTRSILTAVVASVAVAVISGAGCAPTGIGDPCVPEQEYLPTFTGFNYHEVSTESKSFQCQTRLCLVNHFQGRVSCPYGQQGDGSPPMGATPYQGCTDSSGTELKNPITGAAPGCCTPGIPQPVTGPLATDPTTGQPVSPPMPADMMAQQAVPGQCTGRTADRAVYCSCRCANINGATDDGAVYCACPEGFTCTQLVTSISAQSNEGLTGAYCIKNGTQYNPNGTECAPPFCNPAVGGCGKNLQGVTK
ncbi:MAG TPA: hypothetical protein VE987_07685 [Polyangiaceae bacterium]|nr:hypothetical protein [Polyangiaceae bacterium]